MTCQARGIRLAACFTLLWVDLTKQGTCHGPLGIRVIGGGGDIVDPPGAALGEARRAVTTDGRCLANKTGDVRRPLVDEAVRVVGPDVECRVAGAIGHLKGGGGVLGQVVPFHFEEPKGEKLRKGITK